MLALSHHMMAPAELRCSKKALTRCRADAGAILLEFQASRIHNQIIYKLLRLRYLVRATENRLSQHNNGNNTCSNSEVLRLL